MGLTHREARGAQLPPRPLAVTMGDPAGIGPDILLAAWSRRHELALTPFVAFADPAVLSERARSLGLDVALRTVDGDQLLDYTGCGADSDKLHIAPVACPSPVTAGRPDPRNAPAVIGAIERAVAVVEAGTLDAVVTCPIAKHVLYDAGFPHPGHTEFLAALARRARPGAHIQPVMMLACDALRVVPATIHIPIAAVPGHITAALIETTARAMHASLVRDFGILSPRIAVAGLNPHAGENGALGTEDRDIIAPTIARLKTAGLAVTGPHPADTLFHAEARRGYDAVLAMYHDQALIPIKTLAFDTGVNVTIGLPFVRTSPDHGTAFDIAGTGRASPASFIAALQMARAMADRRRAAT